MATHKMAARPPAFVYRHGQLHCEQVPLERLAQEHGTPLYVYSAAMIRGRFRQFDAAFGRFPHTVCYSVKANSNLSLLRMLARQGAGFDVVSGGELQRVLLADRRAGRRVVFSGVGKTREEMEAALQADILLFNVESAPEMALLAACAARRKKRARVAFRVNPDVPAKTHPYISTGLHKHKFGVPIREAEQLYEEATRHSSLDIAGVSVHIGSQITSPEPFRAAMERVAALVRKLQSAGHNIRYVDAGGGLGISYDQAKPADFPAQTRAYVRAVTGPLRQSGIHLLLEPGRSIVGPAGALLVRVLYVKHNNGKRFAIVDGAMNDLIRPALYGAHHEIVPVSQARKGSGLSGGQEAEQQARTASASSRDARGKTQARKKAPDGEGVYDVVGPICETGDFFARDRRLPELQEGDLLAILDAGAYGMSLASNYNTRPRAAEVMVEGRRARVIRRRERLDYLIRGEQ